MLLKSHLLLVVVMVLRRFLLLNLSLELAQLVLWLLMARLLPSLNWFLCRPTLPCHAKQSRAVLDGVSRRMCLLLLNRRVTRRSILPSNPHPRLC
jgi:hypothetical protein